MSLREYWSGLKAAILKSWTMYSAALFVVLGVIELNLSLVKPFVGEKGYAIATIAVACTMALARLKGLSNNVKAGK